MFQQQILPPMVLGRTRELTLRRMRSRSEHEVRAKFARVASLVERLMKGYATRQAATLPADWEKRVKRNQIQGNGHTLPDLVSYEYEGVEVLAVWTYLENDVLHILMRRSKTPADRRPQSGLRPFVWDVMPWGPQMTGA